MTLDLLCQKYDMGPTAGCRLGTYERVLHAWVSHRWAGMMRSDLDVTSPDAYRPCQLNQRRFLPIRYTGQLSLSLHEYVSLVVDRLRWVIPRQDT